MKTKVVAASGWAVGLAAVCLILHDLRAMCDTRLRLARLEDLRAQARAETRKLSRDRDGWARQAENITRAFLTERPKDESTAARLQSEQAERAKTVRAWLALKNAALYQKLRLTAGQIEGLENLAVDRWQRVQDILATAAADGLVPSDPPITTLQERETARYNQELADLLGTDDTAAIAQYDRLEGARSLANGVAGNVFATEPLTAAQAERLSDIIANSSASYQKGGSVSLTGDDIDFIAVEGQARAVLTPGQLAAFESIFRGAQAGVQLNKILAGVASPTTSNPGK